MLSWDPRQYVRDLRSGNVSPNLGGDLRAHRALEFIPGAVGILHTAIISVFNRVQEKRYRPIYPFMECSTRNSPIEFLNLQPAELFKVRSKEEIVATLGKDQRNRGLSYNIEMLRYCGGYFRVLRRVHHIIDENTGKMLNMKHPCIVLEGVVCQSEYPRLCPRAIYP